MVSARPTPRDSALAMPGLAFGNRLFARALAAPTNSGCTLISPIALFGKLLIHDADNHFEQQFPLGWLQRVEHPSLRAVCGREQCLQQFFASGRDEKQI